MIATLYQMLPWWLSIFIIGTICMPVTARLFASLFDKGYIFSKILGIIILSYTMFVLGTLHILPFTAYSLYLLLGIFLLYTALYGRIKKVGTLYASSWKIFLIEEFLFSAGLFVWSLVRGFQPDIHGLEKFMDFGFVNSLLRTTYFPPRDMWLTPLPINYYYFGHLCTAVLTRLTNLPSNITFNLMIATLFSFTLTASFSFGGNLFYLLKKTGLKTFLLTGLLTAILVTFAGNLQTLYTFFTPYQNDNPVPPTQLTFSPQTFPNSYWYPNATRFIYHTIHEFPLYSFVVSDLHGHVLDIPIVFLILTSMLVIVTKPIGNWKMEIGNSLLLGGLAGVAYMTNAWDGLIYLLVSAFVMLLITHRHKYTFLKTVSFLFLLVASFIVTTLPFSVFFKPFASQIGLNCAPQFLLNIGHLGPLIFEQGYCQVSPLWQLAILYGFFFFFFVLLGIFLMLQRRKNSLSSTDVFVFGLGVLGFLLIIAPEFVYLKDIYTTYFRANTMFKMVYQSFILLSLVSSYCIVRISNIQYPISNIRKLITIIFLLLTTVLLSLVLIYPYFAITSYYNNLKDFKGLDGTKYLQTLYPDDYAAIQWINAHIKGQPVMLEAQGDSYTDYERISANTGLPTILGWTVHEWLWRGTYDVVPQRVADIQAIYESADLATTKTLLHKYNVIYVYIGGLERTKYPALNEEKFSKLGKLIYSNKTVRIYEIY